MMLAYQPIGRPQAAVLSRSIFGRSTLQPSQANTKRTLRAQNGPTVAQGDIFKALNKFFQKPSSAPPIAPRDLFYNRSAELREFRKKFSSRPSFVTVVVGPPNSGKTRLLKELEAEFEADKNGPPFIYIDGRKRGVTTPEQISKALCKQVTSPEFTNWLENIPGDLLIVLLDKMSAEVNMPGGKLSVEGLTKFFAKNDDDLEETLKKLAVLFEALGPLQKKPVIVIDEANNLINWEEKGRFKPKLKKLLEFLTAISKQDNQVHVILASSDYFLSDWLAGNGLPKNKFKTKVIGNLTKKEACIFVYGKKVGERIWKEEQIIAAEQTGAAEDEWPGIINDPFETTPVPAGAEAKWPAIYELCGGNIGLLRDLVVGAREEGDWDVALRSIMTNYLSEVMDGFEPTRMPLRDDPPLWTPAQWKKLLEWIVEAPHNALLWAEVVALLSKGASGGEKTLLSMVKYNLLALRAPSELARDLDQEVYGWPRQEAVTLPTPAGLWAVKELLKQMSNATESQAFENMGTEESQPKHLET